MKILQINAVNAHKSTGIIMHSIHSMLLENGCDSYVAYPGESNVGEREIAIGNSLDRKIHALYTRLTGRQGLASNKSTKSFIKKLDKIKPDVIHLHNIHSNFINYKILLEYTAKNKIPIVLTLHDCWFFTGKCFHFLDIGCDKWKTQCNNCPKRMLDIPSILKDSSKNVFELRKKLYEKNDIYVVGCSKWVADCASQSPLFKNSHISQIYNGVDIEEFNPDVKSLRDELSLSDNFVILAMANKWFDSKNEKVRQAVLSSLKEDEKLLIVGCNEEQINSNKSEKVVMVGYIIDRNYLARIYRTADVFINLTLIDTLPTVNMEAASCSTPVITYDSGGSGELVKDSVTGYVINQLDEKALLEATQNVKFKNIKREDCRIWAVENFDKNINYRKYFELYQSICEKKLKETMK